MWFSIQLNQILPQYIDICQTKKSIYCVFFVKNNRINIFFIIKTISYKYIHEILRPACHYRLTCTAKRDRRKLAAAEGRPTLSSVFCPLSSDLCPLTTVLPRCNPQYPVQLPLPPKPGKSFEMTRRCGERSGPEYHICIEYVRFQSEQRSFCCHD